jgi:hypothetical protein
MACSMARAVDDRKSEGLVGTVDRRDRKGPRGTVGARSLTINLRTAHAVYNAHLARYNPQARPWTTCRHLLSPIYHEITFFVSEDTHVRTASWLTGWPCFSPWRNCTFRIFLPS